MSVLTNSAEGGSNGTTLTTANSGGGSGSAFNTVSIGSGAGLIFASAAAAHGTLGYSITGASGTTTTMGWTGLSATSAASRLYVNLGSSLPSTSMRLLDVRNSSATACRIMLNASNQLFVQNSAGSTVFTSPTALAANTWYRLELAISISASAATIKYDYYLLDATSPVEAGYSTTAGNTGSTNITTVNFGSLASSTWTGTAYFDDVATTTATTTYLGPATATAPGVPTSVSASAGNANAVVSFVAPTSNGGSAVTGYTATATPGGFTGSVTGASALPITVSGLTNGTAYTFTVHATNSIGNGSESAASNTVTPAASGTTITNTAEGGTNGNHGYDE